MADERGLEDVLADAAAGRYVNETDGMRFALCEDIARLTAIAEKLCIEGRGHRITYSKKVFIPLTHLCRDVCSYCTFAELPRRDKPVIS